MPSEKEKVLDYRRIEAKVHIETLDERGNRSSFRVKWNGLDLVPDFPRLHLFAAELTAERPEAEVTEVEFSCFVFKRDADLSRVCKFRCDFVQ